MKISVLLERNINRDGKETYISVERSTYWDGKKHILVWKETHTGVERIIYFGGKGTLTGTILMGIYIYINNTLGNCF